MASKAAYSFQLPKPSRVSKASVESNRPTIQQPTMCLYQPTQVSRIQPASASLAVTSEAKKRCLRPSPIQASALSVKRIISLGKKSLRQSVKEKCSTGDTNSCFQRAVHLFRPSHAEFHAASLFFSVQFRTGPLASGSFEHLVHQQSTSWPSQGERRVADRSFLASSAELYDGISTNSYSGFEALALLW